MRASRCSHSIVSYGCVPASVKYRRIPIPICSGAMAMRLTPPLLVLLVYRWLWSLRPEYPQYIGVDFASTATCGGSLHHRNYVRVNASRLTPARSSQVRCRLRDFAGESAHKVGPRDQRDGAGWRLGSVDFWSTATSRSKSVTSSKPL